MYCKVDLGKDSVHLYVMRLGFILYSCYNCFQMKRSWFLKEQIRFIYMLSFPVKTNSRFIL